MICICHEEPGIETDRAVGAGNGAADIVETCEIGGEAYTKGKTALELVLAKPGIKSLVVNFCGAFARCDVMMEGVLNAWAELKPDIPVFFSIAGTGDQEAIRMLQEKLNRDPLPDMSEACKAAVEAAKEGRP